MPSPTNSLELNLRRGLGEEVPKCQGKKEQGNSRCVIYSDNDLVRAGAEAEAGSVTALPLDTAQLGLWALLATLTMLFAGFTSAYLVCRTGSDWQPVSLPGILWLNTGLLLLSSIALEVARSRRRRGRMEALKHWLLATGLMGVTFLMGQLFAWRQLVAQGVYIPTSPHSSFFKC